jgi:hypothetical protein
MNISLDYDQTYTRAPAIWDNFITLLKQGGHNVYVVTMRYDKPIEADEVKDALASKVDGIYFTGRKAKSKFMFERGISIDVWVDDMPFFVDNDAKY